MTQTPPTTAIDLFAVLMNGNWSIARRVSASDFGEDTGEEVWSEQGTTAWVGLVGKEDMAINLSRRSLDTADGVEPEVAELLAKQPVRVGLPKAYGGCTCSCHRMPGVMHIAACCRPSDDDREPLMTREWFERKVVLEGDADTSVGPLTSRPTRNAEVGDEEDLASDDRWNAGVNYAIERLCEILGVDPKAINWDAATETLDGDVMSVICNVLVAAYGEEWSSSEREAAIVRAALASPPSPAGGGNG